MIKEGMVHTGYWVRPDGHISGPRFSSQFWIDDGVIKGPSCSGKYSLRGLIMAGFRIKSAEVFGPNGNTNYYIDDAHIYGPNDAVPWIDENIIYETLSGSGRVL